MPAAPQRWTVPTPFPVGPVNAYYLAGRRPALIDAGPRTPEAEAALAAHLARHPVHVVVVSHEHVDHAGLANWLRKEHGARILLHENEAQVLSRWDQEAPNRMRDYDAGLLAAAVPPEHLDRMRFAGHKYDTWGEAVSADETFRAGDRLELGDGAFDVVDAPGHTAGSFVLTDGQLTFSGDTLLETITPNAVSVRASERGALVRYIETLRRLEGREWGLVHPGHGRPFTGAGDIIRRGLRHAEARQARILRELQGGPSTAYEVVRRLFPNLPDNQVFLAVSEALGHLEVLRHAGRVDVERVDGVDHYRARH